MRNLDVPFAEYMELQSRMRAGMRRLSWRERAFATMTVDVLFQTLEESFRVHVTRAIAAGATPEEVRAVVLFSAQFGMTKTWRALRVLNALFTEIGHRLRLTALNASWPASPRRTTRRSSASQAPSPPCLAREIVGA
ncbi:hypothetical protein GCM10022226_36380 [Sphaerisporangium flaviroseum]|uniref:Carboxymuconolactone decarboxylase-like domain-containing protein n=1 Tax=Sphaerisporangium flaviroseum TaxID=509199 RepID=A0ABP7I8V7_9ACTN